ncbi:tmv resistance protein n [Fagus crenata]
MPSIVPTKESEISSSAELSIINEGCSSMVFPALRVLDIGNCVLSDSDFFTTLDCFSALEQLDLSGSSFVSLPSCMGGFLGLRCLKLDDCKQLQEILVLPPKMEEGHLEDHLFGIIFPGNKIPDWFCHHKENSTSDICEIDINEPPHLDGEIIGMALCAVIERKDGKVPVQILCSAEIISNGLPMYFDDKSLHLSGSDHLQEYGDVNLDVHVPTKRGRSDDDDGNLESNLLVPHQKRYPSTMSFTVSDLNLG